ncbi:MAG TPA: paraquat-inducible protein A [Caulobacteraceae bacterium]|jgi:paraquat-inducible protein A|nr:paraquat-inducible protein A [Caulobacteraceae bacterium]
MTSALVAARSMGCPGCGAVLDLQGGTARALACPVCGWVVERRTLRSLDGALACASATLLLLIPANLSPLLTTMAMGATRTSYLASAAAVTWRQGEPLVGVLTTLFLGVFPLARFALLTLVLARVKLGRPAPWLGAAFRWAEVLEIWAMADVFVLALIVTYARLAATIPTQFGPGAWCFVAAGLMTLLTRAALDKRAIWERIAPSRELAAPAAACGACGLLAGPENLEHPCPRCGHEIHARSPAALRRATALTVAGLLLYLPANLYPMATLPIGLTPRHYTVLQGVKDLIQAHLLGLGLLVFVASFLIPIVKLVGLSWCVLSVIRRSTRRLQAKTRVFHVVDQIGRWSMLDPFVIGAFVPVVQYNDLVSGRAEPAATAFSVVVVATMIGARCFDPRLMWDALEARA